MRRSLAILTAVILLLLVLGAAGCGGAADTASQAAPADGSPEAILTAASAASQNVKSAAATLDAGLTFDVDQTKLPEEAKALVGQPMGLTGTFAYATEAQAVDATMALSMMGQTMNVAARMLNGKGWVQLNNQWYEAPAEMSQMLGSGMTGSSTSGSETTVAGTGQKALAGLGIDPLTWLKDLKQVGEETIDGVECYHLTGTPDLTKIMTDMMGLMQNQEALKALDPTGMLSGLGGEAAANGSAEGTVSTAAGDGTATSGTGDSTATTGAAAGADMLGEMASLFQQMTTDVWIAKKDSTLMKFAATAVMKPPAGEDAQGVNAINFHLTLAMKDINKPVTVEAPASSQPWTALQQALQTDPTSVLGPLGGLLGAMGSGLGTTSGDLGTTGGDLGTTSGDLGTTETSTFQE